MAVFLLTETSLYSYDHDHENLFVRDPKTIDLGVLPGAPGAVQTPQIDVFWVPDKTGLHDYINTKLWLYFDHWFVEVGISETCLGSASIPAQGG